MSFFRRAGALIARFFTSAADPAAVANEFKLYSKDDGSGVSQLFGRADDGTVHQITPPGLTVETLPPPPTPPTSDYNFYGITMSPDGAFGYVGNQNGDGRPLWKFRTSDNQWVTPITCGIDPLIIAITPDGTKAYVSNSLSGTVSVVDTATDTVLTTIPGFTRPIGLDVTPDGTTVYVCDYLGDQVIRIDVATDTIVGAPIAITRPLLLRVNPAGTKVDVSQSDIVSSVSVISTTTNTVIATIPYGQLDNYGDMAFKTGGGEFLIRGSGAENRVDTATDSLTGAPIVMSAIPAVGIVLNAAGTKFYVPLSNGDVDVIDAATNLVTATISGVGVTFGLQYAAAQGNFIYITQYGFFGPATVFVIDSTTDTVVGTISGSVTPPPAVLGVFTTMRFDGFTVVDEGGSTVSITAIDTNTIYAFVYQPGGTPNNINVFSDWDLLTTAMGAVAGPKLLQFDDQFLPVTIPAGTWDMTDTVWEGIDKNYAASIGSTLVTFDDGAIVIKLRTVRGLHLVCAGAAAITDLTDGDVFTLDDYSVIGGDINPVIDVSGIGGKAATISVRHGSQVLQQDLGISGLNDSVLYIDVDSASLLEANTVSGTGGALILKLSRVSPNGGFLQSFFTGSVQVENSLGGFNMQPDSLSQLFGGTLNYFSLGGAVNANLTPANWQPGAIIVVKNTSGAGTVTINPSGADTIDGAATHVITTGQGSVILVSDGVSNWMIIGEKV